MIHITEEMVKNMKKLESLNSYISVVADYKKEEEYSNLFSILHDSLNELHPELSNGDTSALFESVEDYTKELYLYTYSEILDIFYCSNRILKSSIEWMDEKVRIEFLLLNGKLAENAYLNELLVNINDNYIASPIKLERTTANLLKAEYHLITA